MRAVVQRVRDCSVRVEGRLIGSIPMGLLVYLGVGKGDGEAEARAISDKILNLRIFDDARGRMNLSAMNARSTVAGLEVKAGILVVPQFTLFGDVRDGRRPSYTAAADPKTAKALYESVLGALSLSGLRIAHGEFQAVMEVSCINCGPVTILVDTEKKF